MDGRVMFEREEIKRTTRKISFWKRQELNYRKLTGMQLGVNLIMSLVVLLISSLSNITLPSISPISSISFLLKTYGNTIHIILLPLPLLLPPSRYHYCYP